MNTKLIFRYAIRELMGIVIMAVAFFWSAGRVDWWSAWAVIILMSVWIILTAVVILRNAPELLAERLEPRKGAKSWDTAILSMLGLTQLARYVIAGLDQRYGWTGGITLPIQIIALVVCALGYGIFIWATAANSFFYKWFEFSLSVVML